VKAETAGLLNEDSVRIFLTQFKVEGTPILETDLDMAYINFYGRLSAFCETCQWLKFPLNGLWAQSKVSPVVGLLPLASGSACLWMEFPPFLMKQLYRCDSIVISLFVRMVYHKVRMTVG
jgi:hypothetical protein